MENNVYLAVIKLVEFDSSRMHKAKAKFDLDDLCNLNIKIKYNYSQVIRTNHLGGLSS